MPVHDLYSKRKRAAERAGQPDVYQYDDIPKPLRYQLEHILLDLLGRQVDHDSFELWGELQRILARELGKRSLGKGRPVENCIAFLHDAPVEHVLDLVELSLRETWSTTGQTYPTSESATSPRDAATEVNQRFREHAVGYQYENGSIIRLESEFVHDQIVRPALHLLGTAGFDGPVQEFLQAHEHYRHGRGRDALVSALRAFESTAKAVCDARGWSYPARPQAKYLIAALFDNGLIDRALDSHFSAVRTTLESGVPTLRNRHGGHGQGAAATPEPPDYLVAYALHLTASAIVFIVSAHLGQA